LFDQAMGGAQRGLDYPAVDRLLQFAAGQSEIALSVSALEDALLEGEESFALDVEVPAGQPAVVAGANDRGRFIFNIIDKGLVTTPTPTAAPTATPGPRATPTPTVTPSATPIPAPPTVRILPEQPRAIAEGQSLSYLLQLSAPSAQAVAVRLALTGGLDASDVQFSPPTVVFSPGELQKTVQVLALFSPENEGTESGQIILLADNAVAENAVTLLISEAGGAVASPTPRPSPTASPTPGPTPALPVAVISGPERVQRTAELLFDASSSVPVRGRFLAQYRWTLRKADDGTELDRQLSGSPIFRVRAEQLGKLLLELQVVDIGSFVSEPRQLQIEVVPEEDSLRLFFENGVATAREGGEIRLRVERIVPSAGNSAPPIPLSARLLRLGGTAGAEEIQIDGAELRWEANDRSPRTVFVRPLEDAGVESTETLSLGLEEVVGVRSSSPKQLLAQIGDNSPRSTVQFGSTLVNLARPQGQGATLLLPVQRTGSLEQALDVRIGFAPSAVAECVEATGGNSRSTPNGLDFDNRDTLLRLPARVASTTLRVSVLPGDRSFAVPNAPCEGFAVRLLDDAAYDLGAGQQAQINLRDGEVVIRRIETDILVKEDAGRAILRLEALANQSFSGDVRLRSINSEKDSARPGVDFELLDERLGLSASALPFRAEATASLKLINNAVADGTRSLLLAVEDPQFSPLNASVDTPRDNSNPLRVTIIDDEEVIEIIPPKPGVPKLILTGGKLKTPLLPKAGEDGRVELLIEPALERADAAVLLQIDLTTEPQAAAYALCDALACVENNTAYIDPDSRLLHILLSDGGAGDLDGEVNGEIRHLGQLLQISAEGLVEPLPLVGSAEPSPSPAPSAPPSRRQGSGAMGLGWLLLLLLWRGYGHSGCVTILRAVRRRRWRPNVPCSMVSATRRYWS
ncbi:MAG: Calx-beta domain-containing protein, partial [Oceanococcaceae bacterium]